LTKIEEWMEFIKKNGDCPEKIYEAAKTPWQKQVALEFLANQQDRIIIKEKLSFHDKLLWAIFTVVILAAMAQYIAPFLTKIFLGI